MVEKVKFILDLDALTELEDQYIDKPQELRKELQQFIKNMFTNTKATELNKTLLCNMEVEEDGKRIIKQTPIPFKDIDFTKYKVIHNPEWKPKDIQNPAVYELAVGDSTWKKLLVDAQYFLVRIDKYNTSLTKGKKADVPTCFEEILYLQLITPTMNLILKQVGKVCEDEFEELNKAEDKKEDTVKSA